MSPLITSTTSIPFTPNVYSVYVYYWHGSVHTVIESYFRLFLFHHLHLVSQTMIVIFFLNSYFTLLVAALMTKYIKSIWCPSIFEMIIKIFNNRSAWNTVAVLVNFVQSWYEEINDIYVKLLAPVLSCILHIYNNFLVSYVEKQV